MSCPRFALLPEPQQEQGIAQTHRTVRAPVLLKREEDEVEQQGRAGGPSQLPACHGRTSTPLLV